MKIDRLEKMLIVKIIILVGFVTCSGSDKVQVTTGAGVFVGQTYTSELTKGQEGVEFLGIPYAEPPTGSARFTKPEMKKPLEEAFDASSYGPSCLQNGFLASLVQLSEDCLTLNIFVPENAINRADTAVMVWIHGGGFVLGNSDFADPRNLAAFGNVIVVSMNYRLDIFGFLSTRDSAAPGNYGLWDQQLAIQWVNLHIDKFGGDKQRITIFGESAGSASVTYQMLYAGNKGLFQRAIAESGALFTKWAYGKSQPKRLEEYASLLNCSTGQSDLLVECLKDKTAAELLDASLKTKTSLDDLLFAPVADESFIDYDPSSVFDTPTHNVFYRLKGVDYLLGICDLDGSAVQSFIPTSTYINGTTKFHLEDEVIPEIASYISSDSSMQLLLQSLLVYKYRDHGNQSALKRRTQLFNMLTDFYFTIPALKSLLTYKMVSDNKAFLYLFSHPSYFSRLPIEGAAHADDLLYVFGFSRYAKVVSGQPFLNLSTIPDSELQFSKAVMSYWTNFAKTGNPNLPMTDHLTTTWPEYTVDEQKFLELGADAIKADDHLYADRVAFWMDLLPQLPSIKPTASCDVSASSSAKMNIFELMLSMLVSLLKSE